MPKISETVIIDVSVFGVKMF